MKISRLTLWQKTLPLKQPYRLSGGRLKFDSWIPPWCASIPTRA
jgi:hypothetical protein